MPSPVRLRILTAILLACLFAACEKGEKQTETATDTLRTDSIKQTPPPPPPLQLTAEDSAVLEAEQTLLKDSSEENFIWYGRRLGYANKMEEAISAFSSGLIKYPDSYKLLRFRGHRYISTREFSLAVRDLEKSIRLMKGKKKETEPDGLPNKLNQPLSTYAFNAWYHLGLAYYMIGDFYRSQNAFQECVKLSDNDDLMVASCDWLYMIFRRMNDMKAATAVLKKVGKKPEIIENDSYLLRIRMYQGKISPDSVLVADSTREDYDLSLATQGYGVANWHYYSGDPVKAKQIFEQILKGKSRYAFGFIAAETDLKRLWP